MCQHNQHIDITFKVIFQLGSGIAYAMKSEPWVCVCVCVCSQFCVALTALSKHRFTAIKLLLCSNNELESQNSSQCK